MLRREHSYIETGLGTVKCRRKQISWSAKCRKADFESKKVTQTRFSKASNSVRQKEFLCADTMSASEMKDLRNSVTISRHCPRPDLLQFLELQAAEVKISDSSTCHSSATYSCAESCDSMAGPELLSNTSMFGEYDVDYAPKPATRNLEKPKETKVLDVSASSMPRRDPIVDQNFQTSSFGVSDITGQMDSHSCGTSRTVSGASSRNSPVPCPIALGGLLKYAKRHADHRRSRASFQLRDPFDSDSTVTIEDQSEVCRSIVEKWRDFEQCTELPTRGKSLMLQIFCYTTSPILEVLFLQHMILQILAVSRTPRPFQIWISRKVILLLELVSQ